MAQLLNNLGLPLVSGKGFLTPNSFRNIAPQVTPIGNLHIEDRDVETESRLQFITQYGGLSTTARLLNTIQETSIISSHALSYKCGIVFSYQLKEVSC